jgi:hypothetical protein
MTAAYGKADPSRLEPEEVIDALVSGGNILPFAYRRRIWVAFDSLSWDYVPEWTCRMGASPRSKVEAPHRKTDSLTKPQHAVRPGHVQSQDRQGAGCLLSSRPERMGKSKTINNTIQYYTKEKTKSN